MTEKLNLEQLLKEKIGIDRVFRDLIEHTEKGKKLFFGPEVVESKEKQHTFCPFEQHPVTQTEGSSFYLHRDKGAICYGGCTPERLGYIDLTKTFVSDTTPQDIMDRNSISGAAYPVAVRYLVDMYGEELKIEIGDVLADREQDVTAKIIAETVDYYHFFATKNDWGKEVIAKFYRDQRHFQYLGENFDLDKFIKENKLGFAPYGSGNDRLYKKLSKRYKDEDIIQSGVCYVNNKDEIKDAFTNYAIVPYLKNGKPYSFMGRAIGQVDDAYKHKRLNGKMPHAAGYDDIVKSNEFYVVEGENTKLALKALGYNAMETRGVNGLHKEHIEAIAKIKRVNQNPGLHKVNLVLDPDEAGVKNTLKIGEMFSELGFAVYIITMPVLSKNNAEGKLVPWYIDCNDMLYAYQHKAKAAFESFKSQRMSFEVFKVLDKIKKSSIEDLTTAMAVFKSLRKDLNAVPIFERVVLVEELIPVLIRAFSNRISFNEDMIRNALVENYAVSKTESKDEVRNVEPVVTEKEQQAVGADDKTARAMGSSEDDQKKAIIEGLDIASQSKANMFILTDDKSVYEPCKPHIPYLIYTNDLTIGIIESKKFIDSILIDSRMEGLDKIEGSKEGLLSVEVRMENNRYEFVNARPII